jgi:hypothetical protein
MKLVILGKTFSVKTFYLINKFLDVAKYILPKEWYTQLSKWIFKKYSVYFFAKHITRIQYRVINFINYASNFSVIKHFFNP